jgi:hypothetical protein
LKNRRLEEREEAQKTELDKTLEAAGKAGEDLTKFVANQINKITDVPGRALDSTNMLIIGAVVLGAIIVLNVDITKFAK